MTMVTTMNTPAIRKALLGAEAKQVPPALGRNEHREEPASPTRPRTAREQLRKVLLG